MKEIELKLLISPEDLPSLRRRAGARARGRGKTRTVRTIYLDTVDRRLAAGGVALRLRHEARHWTQTVKRARSLRAGLSETEETDTDAPGGRVALDRLPDALSAQIAALAGDLPLGPQFETVMSRTRWDVPEGDALVELAIDSGEVRADGRAEAFIEVEMELKRGSPSAVFTLARRLFPTGPLRLSRYNKAARGRRLADGLPAVPPAAPRHAEAVAISRKDTAEAAATAILSECVAQIASNVTAVLADDGPEGAHQLRVGLRRLRSAIRMLCGALASPSGGAALDRIEGEARWLAREVGRLRDLQVAEAELVAPAAAANPAEPGFTVLTAALRERIDAERALLGATLTGARTTAFVWDLAEYVALRGWLDPTDHTQTRRLALPFVELAEGAGRRADRRVRKRARDVETLDHDARHDLRKALKTLRYVVEFCAAAWPAKRSERFVKALKRLQTLFGDLNDAAMAEALFLADDAPAAHDPAAARAAGRLIGGSLAMADHAWEGVLARWRDFEKARRPWV